MNFLKKIGLLAFLAISLSANAQQIDKATLSKIIGQKNYTFVATTAIPMNSTEITNALNKISGTATGGVITLTAANYDVRVSSDSLVVYLPYYGRSYTATLGNDENGYKFTSTDFSYITNKRKKGGWDVTLTTKDVRDHVRMSLTISENGYATLNVSSTNKQPITYNGYVQETKKK